MNILLIFIIIFLISCDDNQVNTQLNCSETKIESFANNLGLSYSIDNDILDVDYAGYDYQYRKVNEELVEIYVNGTTLIGRHYFFDNRNVYVKYQGIQITSENTNDTYVSDSIVYFKENNKVVKVQGYFKYYRMDEFLLSRTDSLIYDGNGQWIECQQKFYEGNFVDGKGELKSERVYKVKEYDQKDFAFEELREWIPFINISGVVPNRVSGWIYNSAIDPVFYASIFNPTLVEYTETLFDSKGYTISIENYKFSNQITYDTEGKAITWNGEPISWRCN
ncbi:hypothetical protein OAQ99_07240 [Candidatus Kapabacteria bacterium]|nr:hypothetical protein [Candidatus Kapabacteria bacterium]